MFRSAVSLVFCAALAFVFASPAMAGRTVELRPAERVLASPLSGKSIELAKARDAIIAAGMTRGWRLVSAEGQRITLRNDIRGKHTVVVAVDYDQQGFSIDYVSSENLNYAEKRGKRHIHPKYFEWVNRLESDILAKLQFL